MNRRNSFQGQPSGRRKSKAASLGFSGVILMVIGLTGAFMGYSGIGALMVVLILLGALLVVAAIIISYHTRRDYAAIPSVSGNIPEAASPSLPVDQRPPVPSWYSSPDTGHLAFEIRNSPRPQVVNNLASQPVPQAYGSAPSAPSFNYKDNDNPPSYDELFNNRY